MKFTILALAAALAAPSVTVVTAAIPVHFGQNGEGELEQITVPPIPIIPDDASLCGSNIP